MTVNWFCIFGDQGIARQSAERGRGTEKRDRRVAEKRQCRVDLPVN